MYGVGFELHGDLCTCTSWKKTRYITKKNTQRIHTACSCMVGVFVCRKNFPSGPAALPVQLLLETALSSMLLFQQPYKGDVCAGTWWSLASLFLQAAQNLLRSVSSPALSVSVFLRSHLCRGWVGLLLSIWRKGTGSQGYVADLPTGPGAARLIRVGEAVCSFSRTPGIYSLPI